MSNNDTTSTASDKLTDVRLAEIRSWLDWVPDTADFMESFLLHRSMEYLANVLAEVDRLRTELAELTAEHERLAHDVGETQIALQDRQQAVERQTRGMGHLNDACRQRDEQIAQMRPLVEALAELPDQLPLRVPTHQYLEAVERAQRIGDAVRQARTLVAQWKQEAPAELESEASK